MTDTSLLFNILAKDHTSGALHSAESGFQALGEKVKKIGEHLAEAFAAEKMFEFAKGSFEVAEQAEKAEKLTEAAIRSTGGAAQITAEHIGKLSESLSKHDAVSQNTIHSGENLLLTFTNIRNAAGKGNDVFDQTSQAVIDMASAMNQGNLTMDNVKATAIQVGKAMNDPVRGITALRRVGVAFSDDQQKTIKHLIATGKGMQAQKMVLAELKREFGGSAAAMATPADRARIAWENFRIKVGMGLMPTVNRFMTYLTSKGIPALSRLVAQVRSGDGAWADLRSAVSGVRTVVADVAKAIEKVSGFLDRNAAAVEAVLVPLGAFVLVMKGFALYTALTEGLVTAFWALDAAMSANPVGLVVAGIVALGAGLVLAWKKSETFRNIVTSVWNKVVSVVGGAVKGLVSFYGGWVDMVLNGFEHVLRGLGHLPRWLGGGKFTSAANAIGKLRDEISAGVDAINSEIDRITQDVQIHATISFSESVNPKIAGQLGAQVNEAQADKAYQRQAFNEAADKAQAKATDEIASRVVPQTFSGGGGGGGGGGSGATKAKKKAQDYGKLIGLAFMKGLTGSQSSIDTAFTRIIDSLTEGGRTQTAAAEKALQKDMDHWAKLRDARLDKLKQMEKDAKDYGAAISKAFVDSANLTSLEHSGGVGAQMVADLTRLRDHATAFASAITQLRKAGLKETYLQQLLTAGPEGGGLAAAQQLLSNKGLIGKVNDLEGQIAAAGGKLAGAETTRKYAAKERDLQKDIADFVKHMRKIAVKVELNVAGTEKEMLALIRKLVRTNGGTADKAFG